jgi:Domain of unknown function (DUF5069)
VDLIRGYPRSPRDRMLGLPMLPRTIDKARALLAGTLGEYVYGQKSTFDVALLHFLELTPEQFLEGVRSSPNDAAMERWVSEHARRFTAHEAEDFATAFTNDGDDDADRARFAERRAKLPEQIRPRVLGWVDLLDVAEGRIV